MKRIYFFVFLIFSSVAGLQAQSILAYYPLLTDAVDTTGNNPDMTLINAPFMHDGVYSNGIYYGNDTTGSEIKTPDINNFNFDDFAVQLEFYVDEYPDISKPIIIGGWLWRWIGVYLNDEGKLSLMINDGAQVFETNEVVPTGKWNRLILAYNRQTKFLILAFNGRIVSNEIVLALDHNNDAIFTNEHGGNGLTFKGYWRKLKFYESSQIATVGEHNEITGIEVLQTPDHLHIIIPESEKEIEMQIIDMSGKTGNSFHLTNGNNNISTGSLQTGAYLLTFSNKSGQHTVKKIVISR